MSKKCFTLISFVLVLGLISSASAELIGHWGFDDVSGDVVFDISGNGNDGTIHGAQSVPGVGGSALEFDGVDDYVETPITDVPVDGTVAAWVNTTLGDVRQAVFSSHNNEEFRLQLNYLPGTGGPSRGFLGLNVLYGTLTASSDIGSEMYDGSWHHAAFVWEGASPGTIRAYWDGQDKPVTYGSQNAWEGNYNRSAVHVIGREDLNNNNYFFAGQIDDVRMYDHALSEIEIQAAMNNVGGKWPFAFGPTPKDGALHEDTWVSMSWGSGGFAASHDVYIGDNFDAVNTGAEGTFQGNQTATFYVVGFPGFAYPDGLVPGTTYYWRIDEVNDTEPNSPWKGDVWSFSIPPKTAYSPDPADGAETVSVDGQLSWTAGFGSKLHYVYFGETFDEVDNAAGALPQGAATYTPGTLKMAKIYYWRVDEFDVLGTYKGNVWSFTTEGAVTALDPANGAVDVTQTPVLTWAPGLGASHEIYFGTDAGSLELKGSGNLGSESYDPGELAWDTTYYWRVDEANNANADSPWTGPLWSFTTANFLIIDDMESYNDLDPAEPGSNRIFLAWIDGFDNPAVNGSVVGYANPPFAEQTIVNSGNQSMPFAYDNAVGKSEATLTLTTNKDWTVNGVNRLTIWYRGSNSNATETMYVTLNGSASIDNEDPAAAQASRWTEWNIDLQEFADQGVNLANVTSITLGLRSVAGGTGMMYFDDIRLYPSTP